MYGGRGSALYYLAGSSDNGTCLLLRRHLAGMNPEEAKH